jgi:hypothetical protein
MIEMKGLLGDDEKGPFTTQLTRDPSIAIVREFQTNGFNPFLKGLLLILHSRRCLLGRIVEAPPWKIHELTPSLDSLREVMEKELSLVSVSLRACFKAFFKNSFSRVH